jgi:hypothetical protein
VYLRRLHRRLLINDKERVLKMGAATLGQSIDEASAVQFMLDSHHLAALDRFVACARRHARHGGRKFTGVVVEIEPNRPVSVHATDLEPLVLRLDAAHPS